MGGILAPGFLLPLGALCKYNAMKGIPEKRALLSAPRMSVDQICDKLAAEPNEAVTAVVETTVASCPGAAGSLPYTLDCSIANTYSSSTLKSFDGQGSCQFLLTGERSRIGVDARVDDRYSACQRSSRRQCMDPVLRALAGSFNAIAVHTC